MGTGGKMIEGQGKRQEDSRDGTIHWLTHNPNGVHVPHPVIIVLQLIYSNVSVHELIALGS